MNGRLTEGAKNCTQQMICLSFLYTGRSKNPYNSDWSFVRTEGGI